VSPFIAKMFDLLCSRAHPTRGRHSAVRQRPRLEPHRVLEFEINLLLKIYVIKKDFCI